MGLPQKKTPFDAEAYLEWEATQEERHEYIAGEVFAMTGGRDAHNTIAGNVFALLRNVLRGGPCRAFIADMKLSVPATDAYFYPDVMVCCDPRDKGPDADKAKSRPCLVVEVLSGSTAAFDRGQKFEHYQTIESLREYLLLEQDRRHADLFRKNGEGLWVLHPINDPAPVQLASLDVSLSMDAIYEDVDFTSEAARESK